MEQSMATYNQSQIGYNQASISYAGTLIINVEGIANPIILNNITVITSVKNDYSTASTIGVISIDYAPTGIITLEVGSSQSGQLLNSLGSVRTSGEIVVELI
jgi:hypothetical protein